MPLPAFPAVPSVSEPRIGRLVSAADVRAATLAVLQTWLPLYLGVVERDRGWPTGTITRPPTPESYRGSIDFEPWQQDESPTLLVVAEPIGPPERSASAGYAQDFQVQVGAVVIVEADPDTALALASLYGTAVMGALAQQGALGGIGEVTRLANSPLDEWDDPDIRDRVRNVTTFHVYVASTVSDQLGLDLSGPFAIPGAPFPPAAPFGTWPAVSAVWPVTSGSTPTTNITVTGLPLAATFTASTSVGSRVLTAVSPAPFAVIPGQNVTAPGVPLGTYVFGTNPQTNQITLSQNATASASGVTVSIV
jgi:hypothetical protein